MAAKRACSKGLGPFSEGLRVPDPYAPWPGLVMYAAAHAKLSKVSTVIQRLPRGAHCTVPLRKQQRTACCRQACAPLGYAAVQLSDVIISSAGESSYLNLSISDTLHNQYVHTLSAQHVSCPEICTNSLL